MRLVIFCVVAIAAVGLTLNWVGRSHSQAPDTAKQKDDTAAQKEQKEQPAAPTPQSAPQPPGEFRPPTPPLVEALDKNRDGELSAEEIKDAGALLKTLDKDNDGQLNEEEFGPALPFQGGGRGGRGGRGGPGGGGRGGRGGFGRQSMAVLEKFDANKDGMLGAEERVKARAFAKENRPAAGGFGRGGGRGPGGGGPDGQRGGGTAPGAGRGRPDGRGPDGAGGPNQGPPDVVFGRGGEGNNAARQPGERLSPDQVAKYPEAKFYDGRVLRTLFFEFENKDWEEELEDFHNTDVEVPAKLIVDGKTYNNVGVRFRGSSSYGGVPRGQKRSMNVTVDLVDASQNVLGYKTLNLLNSHTDPSFLRAVLYNHIARHYIPANEANLVRVVINGESWGVYVNEEQYNKDFVRKWFADADGPRWKVPPDFSGAAALVYHGDNVDDYRGRYEIKAKDEAAAWKDLIDLCKKLQELPDDQIETELSKVLDIDRALWFLAIDNVLIDEDGYYSRGSDYSIYQDPKTKRFHLLPRDSNETFRLGGGGPGGGGRGGRGGGRGFGGPGGPGGAGGGPGGAFNEPVAQRGPAPAAQEPRPDRGGDGAGPRPDEPPGRGPGPGGFRGGPGGGGPGGGPGEARGPTQDPLAQIDADNRPLVRRLLSNKRLRARYLAHVRTIVDEWLEWESIGPVFEEYRALIADDVMRDTRNLSSFADFFDADIAGASGGGPFGGPPGIKRWVEERRAYLLKHPELSKPAPRIVSVEARAAAGGGSATKEGSQVEIVARVVDEVPIETVLLYSAADRGGPFQATEMKAGDSSRERVYTVTIPASANVYYYVEARAGADIGTTSFHPARAEFATLHYRAPAATIAATATATATTPVPSVPAPATRATTIAINEVMAANNRTIKDPQGKFADWIELVNTGKEEVDLSGMYLTDDKSKPRKWAFPKGTTLAPGGFLIVWADEAGKSQAGLHANFKLAKGGETLLLIDRDDTLLDTLEFGEQRTDVAFGRYPNGQGKWQLVPPTPGGPNKAGESNGH